MSSYQVVVGNVGTVYDKELDDQEAGRATVEFDEWVAISKRLFGRAAGEAVTLFKDGEIFKEYEAPDGPV